VQVLLQVVGAVRDRLDQQDMILFALLLLLQLIVRLPRRSLLMCVV
jgi:hypothetical protein